MGGEICGWKVTQLVFCWFLQILR